MFYYILISIVFLTNIYVSMYNTELKNIFVTKVIFDTNNMVFIRFQL